MTVRAITFDIWDTIVVDDSDEPKRAEQGLRAKAEERRHLFWNALNRQAPIDQAVVDIAFNMQESTYRAFWFEKQITLKVADRLEIMLEGLKRELPNDELARLIDAYETMELKVSPDLIPGAAELIAELAGRYKLCVISDAIYTPGRQLRELLDKLGVGKFFSGFVFSDEIERAKPHADCFTDAARQIGAEFSEMVHIGDRDGKDVVGAQAMGMRAILFTATRDEGARDTTKADGIAGSYAELADVIRSLD
ncbi:MAG: HAD family hydrolase [Alphaproteobacteria bacterium]|nr:HAD family hydrolase [Alphaproteobacteria bacterium]